jgi:hypothetical protein
VGQGIFETVYSLRDSNEVDRVHQGEFTQLLTWFEDNIPTPTRFNRTSSKGHYRRRTRGIAWFRDSARECLTKMHALRRLLEIYGHPVDLIQEDRVGYVIYKDAVQVVAEPLSETRTGNSSP